MGRGREFRDSGRRGFDDDFGGQRRADFFEPRAERGSFGGGAPSAPRPVGGPVVDAVVKWFNPEKGFGFVEVADGTGDAFLHIRAVEAAGHSDLQPGTRLEVRTAQGQKGPQVTEVISVDTSTAEAPAPRAPGGFGAGPRAPRPPRPGFGAGGGAPRHTGPTTELMGTVKWYNPTKGFGFIVAEDGGKDVFIHRSVLMRANLPDLIEGQAVRMGVVDGMKGREAATIELGDA
ncbi:cold-shock protein [Salinarimonas chemoclinalis]|uniref:cold-shock protein n=1 Tax=Salinarimonas chemoclinalis TaxID=3241599 RepID=UPI0035589BC9